MVQLRQRVVVDASVVLKWFIHEESNDRALALVRRSVDGELELSLPDFCLVECANAIWRLVTKQQTLPPRRGHAMMAQLAELPFVRMPSRDLVGSAYRVAVDTGTTVYDGMYVALARALGATVITADRRMYQQMSDTEYGPLVQML